MKEEYRYSRKRWGEERTRQTYDGLADEDSALIDANFEPTEGDLWMKNGVFYGREAALQRASWWLGEGGETDVFDGT